jgi:cytochrome b subunit of formate dehydrogenase
MHDRILKDKGLVVRHSRVELVEHWAIALSGLLLLVTGMFELPLANRYYITSVPGLGWSGDFVTTLTLHYAASVVFIAAAVFHLIYHGMLGERGMIPRAGDLKSSIEVIKTFFGKGEEPPFHKYLPEQRLAYVGMAFIIAMLILSGLIKTYKNIYAPDMSQTLVLWATWVHNVFFVLFILAFIAHIGALILKPNRPMIRGIFTGTVALDYARRRHPLWIDDLEPAGGDEAGPEAAQASDAGGAEEAMQQVIAQASLDMPAGTTSGQVAAGRPPVPVLPDQEAERQAGGTKSSPEAAGDEPEAKKPL